MTIQEAIWARRSCRQFRDTPIDDAIIEEMIEAARRVPTPGNGQGNVFGVIRDAVQIRRLAEAAGGQAWISTAPVVFALCARIGWDIADQPEDDYGYIVNLRRFGRPFNEYMKRYPDRRACMTLYANGGPCMPGEHIFLTAVAHGLRACFIGDLDVARASAILDLPEDIVCLFLLPVGVPAEAPSEKMLRPIEEVRFFDRWPTA